MNKAYRVVYCEATQTWTAVGETARGRSRSSRGGLSKVIALLGLGLMAMSPVAWACDIALGKSAKASGLYGVAVGLRASASGGQSVALGADSQASGLYAAALGNLAKASNEAAVALGFRSAASGYYGTAIGTDSVASGMWSSAFGNAAKATLLRVARVTCMVVLATGACVAGAQTGAKEAPPGVDAQALMRLAVPPDLSATERVLVGTWRAKLPANGGGPLASYVIALNEDGTYRLQVSLRGKAPGRFDEITNAGRWAASRGLFTTVATQAADGSFTRLSTPGFVNVYVLREMTAQRLVYEQTTTAQVYEFERVTVAGDGKAQ